MDWTQFDPSLFHTKAHQQATLSSKEIGEEVFKEAERLSNWNEACKNEIERFCKDEDIMSLGFPPMDRVFRYIIHEVAAEHGLSSYSFGEELKDRHTVVYKKGYEPSEDLRTLWEAAHERKPDSFVA